ncbi:50S ribosomal protein L3 [Neisseria bacilliformis ATCC BAA-1200]|uniref:50S ribosomal protein L3 n=1 Tax=Neisseria bacilliformis ATCC BAA-1200 TaxID=888742 RepID=F2B8L1_9NEIS|nr:50S ribosomal protein L3 [Neisseria bacilliformis ATCC BAA-1200]
MNARTKGRLKSFQTAFKRQGMRAWLAPHTLQGQHNRFQPGRSGIHARHFPNPPVFVGHECPTYAISNV